MHFRASVMATVVILASCGGDESGGVEVKFVEQISMPDCQALKPSTDREMRQKAARFFIDEVGNKVERVFIAQGALCGSDVVYAISQTDEKIHMPFFVITDLATKQTRLARPE